MAAPICPIERHETEDKRIDNYHWLRLSDEEKTASVAGEHRQKVEAYLNAENEYLGAQMSHAEGLKEKVFKEMKGRMKKDEASVPYKDNGWFYGHRFEEGGDHPIYERREGTVDGNLQLLVDVNQLAKGHEFFAVSKVRVSPDNRIVAYSYDDVSRRRYTIMFRDLVSGEMYSDELKNTDGYMEWANDNKSLIYVRKDEITLRSCQIYKHVLGTSQEKDELIFEEKDETFECDLFKSKSKRYICVASESTMTTEYRLLDAEDANSEWKVFQERTRELEYNVIHGGDKFYIRTNLDAENFCLMSCPLDKTSKDNWKIEIPHRSETLLKDVEVFKDFLVLEESTGGLTNLRVIGRNSDVDYNIEFSDPAYMAWSGDNKDFDSDVLRYCYSSMKEPLSTFDFNMKTKEKTLLKQKEVVGGYNSEDYVVERIMVTARDGAKVPVSIVYKKGTQLNGENPALLYGYGSYGVCIEPCFDSRRLSLIDRGFVYAIAHIRGSETMGRSWYKDGRLLNKRNTFTDFNDCAAFLIKQKYTNSTKLMAEGRSAGGLLMGAIVNMEPHLYKGVVAGVPFVDVVTTMLDESIPLTTGEFDEWGNPKDPEYYTYMLSYSPQDNVVAQNYPNILVTAGYHDSQVQYWEPAKWVAKLRELKTDDNKVMMLTNMAFGHGGASGRFEKLKEQALMYTFMMDLVGITE